MLSLLKLLKSLLALVNGGSSPNVQRNDVASTSTSSNTLVLKITRTQRTTNAIFGKITKDDGEFICYSMERIAVAIPTGSFSAHIEYSPHFERPTPHIQVPNRTYIEIHPANFPSQLEGCVAVGSSIDNEALDNSKAAFEKLMAILPETFTVLVEEQPE